VGEVSSDGEEAQLRGCRLRSRLIRGSRELVDDEIEVGSSHRAGVASFCFNEISQCFSGLLQLSGIPRQVTERVCDREDGKVMSSLANVVLESDLERCMGRLCWAFVTTAFQMNILHSSSWVDLPWKKIITYLASSGPNHQPVDPSLSWTTFSFMSNFSAARL
jgi:hypothetical protein